MFSKLGISPKIKFSQALEENLSEKFSPFMVVCQNLCSKESAVTSFVENAI